MKAKNAVKYLVVLSLILSTSYAIAEESGDIYIGALFGYGQSIHHNIKYQYQFNGCDAYCPTEIDKEISQDYYLGLNFEYILFSQNFFSNSLNFSLAYQKSEFRNQTPGDTYPSLVEDNYSPSGLKIVQTYTSFDEKMNFEFINSDILYKIKFTTLISYGLSLGPFISIPIKTNSLEEYKLIKPDSVQFTYVPGYKYKDRYRTVVLFEGKINDVNPFYWGIKTNCFVEYEFWDLLKTTAEVGYSYPLSNFVKDSEWKIESFYANLIISFKLN